MRNNMAKLNLIDSWRRPVFYRLLLLMMIALQLSGCSDVARWVRQYTTEKLDQSGWPTNHPKVEMNLPTFRRDVKFAREAIEREPPNYLLAATATGACVLCHGRK